MVRNTDCADCISPARAFHRARHQNTVISSLYITPALADDESMINTEVNIINPFATTGSWKIQVAIKCDSSYQTTYLGTQKKKTSCLQNHFWFCRFCLVWTENGTLTYNRLILIHFFACSKIPQYVSDKLTIMKHWVDSTMKMKQFDCVLTFCHSNNKARRPVPGNHSSWPKPKITTIMLVLLFW